MNPAVGRAIEAAREAEEKHLAQEQEARRNGGDAGGDAGADAGGGAQKSPVHRVEIEAAEMVPSHSGRAERGYAVRIHREAANGDDTDFWGQPIAGGRGNGEARPETHVFAGHRDLLSFLRDELAQDAANSR